MKSIKIFCCCERNSRVRFLFLLLKTEINIKFIRQVFRSQFHLKRKTFPHRNDEYVSSRKILSINYFDFFLSMNCDKVLAWQFSSVFQFWVGKSSDENKHDFLLLMLISSPYDQLVKLTTVNISFRYLNSKINWITHRITTISYNQYQWLIDSFRT